jgi:hypothetical protein
MDNMVLRRAMVPSKFFHSYARPKILQSVCLFCGKVLGAGRSSELLRIIERAHHCKGPIRPQVSHHPTV